MIRRIVYRLQQATDQNLAEIERPEAGARKTRLRQPKKFCRAAFAP
jgi:hypothetical protein